MSRIAIFVECKQKNKEIFRIILKKMKKMYFKNDLKRKLKYA
jgi:hypothetical protein